MCFTETAIADPSHTRAIREYGSAAAMVADKIKCADGNWRTPEEKAAWEHRIHQLMQEAAST